MFNVSPAQLAALMGSHQMDLKVSVLRDGVWVADIGIESGNISATYATQGGRDGSITVDRNVTDQGLLNPLSDEVYIRTGIPGFVEVPIFTGRVDAHNLDSAGNVEVQLLSRSAEAIRAAFETPWAALDNNTAANEIRRILLGIDNTWAVDVSRANANTIGVGLVWEDDPGQAMDQLARGASLIWQPDRTGGFEVFTNPYVSPSGAPASIVFRDGQGGTTVEISEAKSREGIFNSVTVVAEKYGNQAPVRVTVRDNGVSSPTRWGGPFGKQNLIVKSQIPIDVNGCLDLASRVLNQSLALQRTWTITMPHFPLLDPGDIFGLWYLDEITTQVVESVDYTLDAQDPTVITSRELREIAAEIIVS
jgi:hypothetical protein